MKILKEAEKAKIGLSIRPLKYGIEIIQVSGWDGQLDKITLNWENLKELCKFMKK